MEFKRVTESNYEIIQSIVKEFRDQTITAEKAKSFITNPMTVVFACVENDVAIGYIMAYRMVRMDNGNDIMQIYHLFVKEAHRRKGIAKELMRLMLEYANSEKIHYLYLLTGKDFIPARKLYESMGGYNHPDFKETYYWYITGEPHP